MGRGAIVRIELNDSDQRFREKANANFASLASRLGLDGVDIQLIGDSEVVAEILLAMNEKADLAHSHAEADVVNLVTDLASKAGITHVHPYARREVRPASVIAETVPIWACAANQTLTSTRMTMTAIALPACTVSSISVRSGTVGLTPGTGPHLWFALYDANLNLLAQSADDTAPVWAAGTILTKNLTAPQTVPEGLYYIGVMVNAGAGGTMPNAWQAQNTSTTAGGLVLNGYSNSGLTATAPNPASAVTQYAGPLYAYVS